MGGGVAYYASRVSQVPSKVSAVASTPDDTPSSESKLGALGHGLAVFEMFDTDRQTLTVIEISRALGIHKSTASRIAANLVRSGYLVSAPNGQGLQLSGKFARLGALAAPKIDLSTAANPYLLSLAESTGETCHVGVLEGDEAVTIALANGSYAVRLHSWVGKRSKASTTAMGKSMLADLSQAELDAVFPSESLPTATEHSLKTKGELNAALAEIREKRYAFDDEELEMGLRCVAVPIVNHERRVVAAVTVAAAASRLPLPKVDQCASAATATARAISAHLGAPDYRPYAR
ncbi:MAG: IclR family transcriptional regulator [Hyphomicrobiales bacterium]|nr:MAG: IclR family transcriptional regulator [Hyphomicrobiales bacterium]